ncbi:MAG: flagellar hook-length control protein FliK [Vampirovibrionales bacterium]
MMITVAPASESILKAVSSANSAVLVVNAKNNSATNDFKSALNQAKQDTPSKDTQSTDTQTSSVKTPDDNESTKLTTTDPASEEAKAESPDASATPSSVDTTVAMPYVTPPPLPTLTIEVPTAELNTEAKTTIPLLEALKKPETPLELTPVNELDPALVQKAIEAVKLDANDPTPKSFTLQDAVQEKVLEASQLLNLEPTKVVQDAPILVSANALEASLKVADVETPTETPLETENSTLIEAPVAQADKPSTEGEGFSKEGEAPKEDPTQSDASTLVQNVVPDVAFAKPVEGVATQNQGVQGIQPLTNQVANGIKSAYDSSNKTMQIQLNPEDLGHMRIQIKQIGEGQVSARLVVERPEAVEQVKTQLQDLQRNLEQQGLKMDKIEVVLAGANSQASSDSNKDQNKDNAEQARFQDGLNKDGAFQQTSQEEQAQSFQDELKGLNPQGAYPLEGQDSQVRLEELNALRQSYQSYKQQSVSTPEVPKNQVFSTFNSTGLNVLA